MSVAPTTRMSARVILEGDEHAALAFTRFGYGARRTGRPRRGDVPRLPRGHQTDERGHEEGQCYRRDQHSDVNGDFLAAGKLRG